MQFQSSALKNTGTGAEHFDDTVVDFGNDISVLHASLSASSGASSNSNKSKDTNLDPLNEQVRTPMPSFLGTPMPSKQQPRNMGEYENRPYVEAKTGRDGSMTDISDAIDKGSDAAYASLEGSDVEKTSQISKLESLHDPKDWLQRPNDVKGMHDEHLDELMDR